jgi:hypothetical protein
LSEILPPQIFAKGDSRGLTEDEIALARSVFGDAIRYSDVEIRNRKWWWFQPKMIAMAPRGHIHFHPKSDMFCSDFCETPLSRKGLFIHEMTHVWQHQMGTNLMLKRHPFCRYDYSIKPGWTLKDYGIEQQAEIVRHYFLHLQGRPAPGSPPIDVYRQILPFA